MTVFFIYKMVEEKYIWCTKLIEQFRMVHDPGNKMSATETFSVNKQVLSYLVKNGLDGSIQGTYADCVWHVVLQHNKDLKSS